MQMLFNSPHLLCRALLVKTAIFYLTAYEQNHPLSDRHFLRYLIELSYHANLFNALPLINADSHRNAVRIPYFTTS